MLDVRLSELLGQPQASAFLRSVVGSRRFANAYLFHGPAGVGKMTAAFAFARAMLCTPGVVARAAEEPEPGLFDLGPPPPAAAAPADEACGVCAACVKALTLQHPDLRFLFPLSGEEKDLENTVAETHQALREDPLFVFRYEKYASIRLSATRDLLRELGYKPYEAERRVVVVRDADRMREDQYSAMLKAIEEPGASTVWVLTSARLSRLPATIRSRCQKVRFAPLAESTVREVLESRAAVPAATSPLLAALAGGSLSRALELRDEAILELSREGLALLEPARRGDAAGLWAAAQKFMRYGKTGRESLRRTIEFHQLWLRDLLRARYDAPIETLIHADRVDELRRQAERLDATEIRRRLMVLEEMLRAIEGNVTADLTLFSGLARVAGAHLGEGDWPRHATARWEY
jgi:DNA polymerase-3 subunit delta'